jgi:hypothetical protein
MVVRRVGRFFVAVSTTAGLLCLVASGAARAEQPSNDVDRVGGYVFDVALLRTTGLVQTVIGAVILVPAYLLSLGSGQSGTIVERCVAEPARYTFERKLGDF